MTGHGRGTATANGVRVVAECFSVNRRQGEVILVTARELGWIEPRVREEVLKRISRGKVQVSIAVERPSFSASLLINKRLAARFLQEARSLQKELDLGDVISLETVLAAPGVLNTEDNSGPELWPLISRALATALKGLLTMRVREGAHLKQELAREIMAISALVRRVRVLAPRYLSDNGRFFFAGWSPRNWMFSIRGSPQRSRCSPIAATLRRNLPDWRVISRNSANIFKRVSRLDGRSSFSLRKSGVNGTPQAPRRTMRKFRSSWSKRKPGLREFANN